MLARWRSSKRLEFKVFFQGANSRNSSTKAVVWQSNKCSFVKVGCQIWVMTLMYRPWGIRSVWHLERYRILACAVCWWHSTNREVSSDLVARSDKKKARLSGAVAFEKNSNIIWKKMTQKKSAENSQITSPIAQNSKAKSQNTKRTWKGIFKKTRREFRRDFQRKPQENRGRASMKIGLGEVDFSGKSLSCFLLTQTTSAGSFSERTL